MTYAEKLKRPEWQKKRLEVFERDQFKCLMCLSTTKTLAVHHCYYLIDAEPWEYPLSAYRTLCEECHQEETENLKIAEKNLIHYIKRAGFDAQGINILVNAFQYLEDGHSAKEIATIINLLLSRTKEIARLKKLVKKELPF